MVRKAICGPRKGFEFMLEIRVASKNDLPSLSIFKPLVHEVAEAARLEHLIDNGDFFVALFEDQIVGLVARDQSFFNQDFIPKLFVLESFRKHGIGQALMNAMARACRTEKIFSSTNLSNAPMLKLFRKLEWAYAGTIDHIDSGDPEVFFVKYKSDNQESRD
jgi:GNAT superfamily N-acetyltransferase